MSLLFLMFLSREGVRYVWVKVRLYALQKTLLQKGRENRQWIPAPK